MRLSLTTVRAVHSCAHGSGSYDDVDFLLKNEEKLIRYIFDIEYTGRIQCGRRNFCGA